MGSAFAVLALGLGARGTHALDCQASPSLLCEEAGVVSHAAAWRAWTPDDDPWPAAQADLRCSWGEIRSTVLTTDFRAGRKPDMSTWDTLPICLREGDHISEAVSRRHRWHECYRFVELWLMLDGPTATRSYRGASGAGRGVRYASHFPPGAAGPSGILLEVGANIGACTLEILLLTNATVVSLLPRVELAPPRPTLGPIRTPNGGALPPAEYVLS
jgi:hypothetical protein